MEGAKVSILLLVVFSLIFAMAQAAQSPSPAPPPTNDGLSIDQGIAYVLMLVALALTYLIH